MSARIRRLTTLAAVVGMLAVSAACGLSAQDEPEALTGEVPFGLLEPRPSTSTTTSSTLPALVTEEAPIYLAGPDGRLVPVLRTLPTPIDATDLLEELLEGATDEEAAAGLRSVITADTRLRGVTRRPDNLAVIDLSAEFGSIQGEEGITAVAQVVYTATEIEGISSVTFSLDGQPIDVPRGDGTLTSGPLTRFSFPNRKPAEPAPPGDPGAQQAPPPAS